ncbi:MAG: hypothetical protein WKF86_00405 [Acidimicrobiales bacterium]
MSSVYVIDSSSLIELKKQVGVAQQWDTFRRLEVMVEEGQIALAQAVINEVSLGRHPDAPGAWAKGMQDKLIHPREPAPQYVREVM